MPTESLTLEKIKNYLRINIDDDDTLLTMLLSASEKYVKDYTGLTELTELELTAQQMIIANWYDNRSTVVIGKTATEIPFGATQLLDINRNIPLC